MSEAPVPSASAIHSDQEELAKLRQALFDCKAELDRDRSLFGQERTFLSQQRD